MFTIAISGAYVVLGQSGLVVSKHGLVHLLDTLSIGR
jgi:hypothetical protein